jgi:hypothetical protein
MTEHYQSIKNLLTQLSYDELCDLNADIDAEMANRPEDEE